jgi:hypothetical protein
MTLVISKGLTLDNGTRAAAIAGVSPTLDYRFARERREIETVSLTDKLTYTGGNGTFVGSDGFIQRATTNVPRFDHDPLSRRSLGLLSEVERTNSIRNNTMVGAVAGTPGTLPTNWSVTFAAAGLTRGVVGTGTENGATYLDIRCSGTPSSTGALIFRPEPVGAVPALSGQTWTFSAWARIVAGSFSNLTTPQISVAEWAPASVFVAESLINIGSIPSSLLRVSGTRALTGGTTAFVTGDIRFFVVASGVPVDITLRIGFPQLELGATASTPIPTSGTAVTRTADSAVIDGTGVITGTYTMVEKPAGCAVASGSNINLQPGFTAERVMVFPAALDAGQITAIRGAM